MKPIIALLTSIIVLGISSETRASEASTANPADAIRGFYRWYVTELIAHRQPLENRRELTRFATERLINQIEKMKKGPDGLDGDYFLDAQDFDNLWAKNITISDLKVSGGNATAEVRLTGKGEMRRRLKVWLVNDGGAWRIDKVQGRD